VVNGLPPDGAVLATEYGRFRAIIVRPGQRADTAVLRGWYLDRERISEQYITVELAGISVLEPG
jgi:hypothetical protein